MKSASVKWVVRVACIWGDEILQSNCNLKCKRLLGGKRLSWDDDDNVDNKAISTLKANIFCMRYNVQDVQ
jgi:hypothetical protein